MTDGDSFVNVVLLTCQFDAAFQHYKNKELFQTSLLRGMLLLYLVNDISILLQNYKEFVF